MGYLFYSSGTMSCSMAYSGCDGHFSDLIFLYFVINLVLGDLTCFIWYRNCLFSLSNTTANIMDLEGRRDAMFSSLIFISLVIAICIYLKWSYKLKNNKQKLFRELQAPVPCFLLPFWRKWQKILLIRHLTFHVWLYWGAQCTSMHAIEPGVF